MDDAGQLSTAKALTTPGQLEVGVFEAISLAAAQRNLSLDSLLSRVLTFGHGTTQATNALIERDGAITGLITTRGFGDTLALQRLLGFTSELSADQLNWYSRRRYPDPIVPRSLVREVPERVDQSGQVLVALDESAVRKAIHELLEHGVETFAIALLWSFRNPVHERRIGQLIAEMRPDAYVSLSCDVSPVLGEYERTATTAMNSYLAPKVVSYLSRFEDQLRERKFRGSFYVLNSAGGVIPAKEAARKPVLLVASGPTGGVMGSLYLARALGERNVITTDMGGTSFDVALIVDEKPLMSTVHEAGGFHLATPMIDIRAIGAGGGSIATVKNGMVRVGPESAGARPGPVCYARGGTRATVTDADVVLGIISPTSFLGGRMRLDRDGAFDAINTQIAKPLGLSVEQAASGIRKIVDAHMADTLREVTIGRGHDPRDFVLFAYGGAGPAHCAGFSADLGVSRIVVPATSMAHSAYGALASDTHITTMRSMSLHMTANESDVWEGLHAEPIASAFEEMQAECRDALISAGASDEQIEITRNIDMRYRRQTQALIVPVDAGPFDDRLFLRVVRLFEEIYEALYGRGSGFRQAGVETTTLRVGATAHTKKPAVRGHRAQSIPRPEARQIFDSEGEAFVSINVWNWLSLPANYVVQGPAVIEHPETTVYIAPTQIAALDGSGNLSITRKGQ